MKKLVIIYSLTAIPLVLFSAYKDVLQFGVYDFKSYFNICLWEYMIFGLGLLGGIYYMKYKKLRGKNGTF